MNTFRSEPADTPCPECRGGSALYESVDIGMPDMVHTSGQTTVRYVCMSCHFLAWGGDAMRANGIATDAQVPDSWRVSARKYTARLRH